MTPYRKPDYQLPQEPTSQMMLGQDVPDVGKRYRNIYSGYFATVLEIRQEKRCWIKLRKNDSETDITLEALHTYWEPEGSFGGIR